MDTLPEFEVRPPIRTSVALQVIAGGRVRPAALPVIAIRKTIYERYEGGETERDISKRLGVGIESVRLTLRGYFEIHRRMRARSNDRALRAQEAEIAAEVWDDLRRAA